MITIKKTHPVWREVGKNRQYNLDVESTSTQETAVNDDQESRVAQPADANHTVDWHMRAVISGQALMVDRLQAIQAAIDYGHQVHTEDHKRILGQCERTQCLLEDARRENRELKRLLNKYYPVERMRTVSASILLACVLSIMAALLIDVTVIHPLLAAVGIIASAAFMGMAHWRARNAS